MLWDSVQPPGGVVRFQQVTGQIEFKHDTVILEINFPSYHLEVYKKRLAAATGS